MTLDDFASRDSAVDTRVDPCRKELLLLLSGKTNCAFLARKRAVAKAEFSDGSLDKGLPVFKQSTSIRFVRQTEGLEQRERGFANNHGKVCYRQTNSRL